jgi:hypothetical protein
VHPFITEAERVSDLGQRAAGQMHAAHRVVEVRAGEFGGALGIREAGPGGQRCRQHFRVNRHALHRT